MEFTIEILRKRMEKAKKLTEKYTDQQMNYQVSNDYELNGNISKYKQSLTNFVYRNI